MTDLDGPNNILTILLFLPVVGPKVLNLHWGWRSKKRSGHWKQKDVFPWSLIILQTKCLCDCLISEHHFWWRNWGGCFRQTYQNSQSDNQPDFMQQLTRWRCKVGRVWASLSISMCITLWIPSSSNGLCIPFVQFMALRSQRHTKDAEFLERDHGGSGMQPWATAWIPPSPVVSHSGLKPCSFVPSSARLHTSPGAFQ